MAYKLAAQTGWRAVNAPHLVALVRASAVFHKGKLLKRPIDTTPTEPTTDAAPAAGLHVPYFCCSLTPERTRSQKRSLIRHGMPSRRGLLTTVLCHYQDLCSHVTRPASTKRQSWST
jgi:hypothetical protein